MISKQPLISIIMNCYNCEKYLEKALDSVYAQTYKNWEIIFWDNASTDKSSEIVKKYDERLRYFRAEETTPLGEARVYATGKTKGNYIAFLDTDDEWYNFKLERQIEEFQSHNELGFVYGRTEVVYERDENKNFIYGGNEALLTGDIFSELAKDNFITFSSVMVKKEKFISCGGFPSNYKNSPDYAIFLRLSQKYSVGAVQEVCCKYRMHNSNLSSLQYVTSALESIDVLNSLMPDDRVKTGLQYQSAQLAIAYIKEKKMILAIKTLLHSGSWLIMLKRIISYVFK